MRLSDLNSPSDHPAAVWLHGIDVWAVKVGGRATAVKLASSKGWTAFRWLGDWFVSSQKPSQKGAEELLRKVVPNPANLSRADDAIAVVPDQQSIAYKGFTVTMKPSEFLHLCPQRTHEPSKRLDDAVRAGQPIGPPFLEVSWIEDPGHWQVYGHEGRGRALSILKHFGDEPIEIDVLPQYMRARDLTPAMKKAPFVKDIRKNPRSSYNDEVERMWRNENVKAARHDSRKAEVLARLLRIDPDSAIVRLTTALPEDIHYLASKGKEYNSGNFELLKMEPISCHSNSAQLYDEDPENTFIVTGYGLGPKDNLWREHTWAMRDGRGIETTVLRKAYFGYPLTKKQAEEFMDANWV